MSWLDRPEKKQTNPAVKFLEWKSEEGKLSYYDKEKQENVFVDLPFSFVILEHYHTVKGWHDESESGIYANEVFAIGTEELKVKAFKGGLIKEGLYKEIKDKVKAEGAHYCRSIYAVTNDLELVNISLKGSGVKSYSTFVNDVLKGDHNFDKQWIKITGAEEKKKGKVKYSVPVFEISSKIKDKSKLEPFAEELQNYMIEYNSDNVLNKKVVEPEVIEEEEQPF